MMDGAQMTTQTSFADGDAVSTLFSERQRYEGWIAALEAKRASTPQHIYDRVRADYDTRLRGVLEQLRTHRASVDERAKSLTQRTAEIDTETRKHQDERAEVELRASIGEIEDDKCQETLRSTDEQLGALASERESLNAELERLREILKLTSDPVKPAAARPAAAAPAPAGSAPAAAPAAAQRENESAPPAGTAFDELEFLKSVTDSRERGGIATADPTVQAERSTSAERSIAADANGATRTGTVPVFLRDVPSEQTKTLKCQECSTMNYPTEWYCERCGAELAAL
jgi:septal ring factor EnvC (AmiA/AmiB activator)